jgi:hypothetical protein
VNACLRLAQISSAYYLNISETAVMGLPNALFKKDDLKKKLMGVSGYESLPKIDEQINCCHEDFQIPAFIKENIKANCHKESRRIAKFTYDEWLGYSGLTIVDSLALEEGCRDQSYDTDISSAAIALGNLAAASRIMAQGRGEIPALPIFDQQAEEIEKLVILIRNNPNFITPQTTRKSKRFQGWVLTNNILYDAAKDKNLKS